MKNKTRLQKLCLCAVVAALYAAVTILTAPLSYGMIQFRLSEALVVLCALEPRMGVGITAGCFLANILSTATGLDAIVGTLATALACFWTSKLKNPWALPIPNILCNGLLVGAMLAWVLFPKNFLVGFFLALFQVSFGEAAVMYVLGLPLYHFVRRSRTLSRLFP